MKQTVLESLIKKRKSIRQFTEREVKRKEIEEILDIARFAPSGKNRQPWKIRILEGERKESFCDLIRSSFPANGLPGSLEISVRSIDQSSKTLLFFNPYSYSESDYSRNRLMMDIQSLGAFIDHCILLATERGISTLWINDIYYVKERIEEKFGSEELELVAAVAFGYSDLKRNYNLRKEVGEILL